MNLDFLKGRYDPDPLPYVVARSKEFASEKLVECEQQARKAERELEEAEEKYDEASYFGGTAIAKAHINFQQKEALRDHAQFKFEWEHRREYAKRIPTDKKYTKRLLADIDWKNIRKP